VTNSGSLLLLLELGLEPGRPKPLVLLIELELPIVPNPSLLLVGLALLPAVVLSPKLVLVLRRWPAVPPLLGPKGRWQQVLAELSVELPRDHSPLELVLPQLVLPWLVLHLLLPTGHLQAQTEVLLKLQWKLPKDHL
jgi:hypothetical protein